MSKKTANKEKNQKDERIKKFKRTARTVALNGIPLALVAWGVYALFTMGGPSGDDFSEAVPIMDTQDHIAEGESESVEYNSNPPTSGPHYEEKARHGMRSNPIADGHLVANLEQGDIWISFHPRVEDDVWPVLQQFFSRISVEDDQSGGIKVASADVSTMTDAGPRLAYHQSGGQGGGQTQAPPSPIDHLQVVITPRPENDTDIALAAWGQLDTFDLDDLENGDLIERIEDFALRYQGEHAGHESQGPSVGGV